MLREDWLDDDDAVSVPTDEFASRPVPGLVGFLLNAVEPKPYPINIYNIDDDSVSGLAGTLFPDGTYSPLPTNNAQATHHRTGRYPVTRYWDDVTASFVEGEVRWDGVIVGSIAHFHQGEAYHKRLWDGSVIGDWPDHPPRAEKVVNPDKAREAAREAEQEKTQWN